MGLYASWDIATAGAVVGGAIGSIVTGITTAFILLRKGKSEIQLAEQKAKDDHDDATRKTAISEWQVLMNQYKEQSERRDEVINQLQEAIGSLQEDHSDCREDNAELRTAVTFIYEHMKHLHTTMVANGKDPGALPTLPEMHERPKRGRTEFLLNQAQQSSNLVRKADETVAPPSGRQTPGGPSDLDRT